jgi:hypothetical protein
MNRKPTTSALAERETELEPVERSERERRSMVVPKSPLAVANSELATPSVDGGVDTAHLSYRLVRPASASGVERWRLTEAYRCWKTVWSDTLRELDNATRVFSDDFTRQEELGALFFHERCVGLTGFRWVDLSLEHHRNDSYFKAWPEYALGALSAAGSRICVGSNLTVLPEWRGPSRGFSVKAVLMGLAVKRFLASSADSMAGTMRNDRGMNGLVYHLGATPLAKDVIHHGVKVDLVVFSRGPRLDRPRDDEAYALTNRLWAHTKNLAGRSENGQEGRNHENRAG